MEKCSYCLLFLKLHEPYTDHPETKGVMRVNPETLRDVIPKFLQDGWQVVSIFNWFISQYF